jgi:hypothetical protein
MPGGEPCRVRAIGVADSIGESISARSRFGRSFCRTPKRDR